MDLYFCFFTSTDSATSNASNPATFSLSSIVANLSWA